MPKKRNKRYNPKKVVRLIDRMVLKNKVVTYVTGDSYNNLYCLKQKKLISVDKKIAVALAEQPFEWSILIAVICRDQNGTEYIKSELIASNQKYFQHELISFLAEKHQKLIQSVNRTHVIGVGWLASPEGRDWEEDQAGQIFEQLGAFNAKQDPDTGDIYPYGDPEVVNA